MLELQLGKLRSEKSQLDGAGRKAELETHQVEVARLRARLGELKRSGETEADLADEEKRILIILIENLQAKVSEYKKQYLMSLMRN